MAAYAVAIGLIGWAAFCVGVEGVKRQHLLSAKVVLVTDH
jgi:hypothetical protein